MSIKRDKSIIFSGLYAESYDLLYSEKDYEAECDFIESIFRIYSNNNIKNILDIGCGTGGHSLILARRGYRMYGIDRSPEMIKIAKHKARIQKLNGRVYFEVNTIQNLNLKIKFDAVMCMFNVLGYQTTNEELFTTLCVVKGHLKSGGIFICDFWYGPAVLCQKPECRVKFLKRGKETTIRIAEPEVDMIENIVSVKYNILNINNKSLIGKTEELHRVRYFFKPEMEFLMKKAGLRLLKMFPFLNYDGEISERTWNVMSVAKV